PDGVSTHIVRDVVVCLLEGGFTRAQETVHENRGTPVITVVAELMRSVGGRVPASLLIVNAAGGRGRKSPSRSWSGVDDGPSDTRSA
ncbi:MAG TPA: hypothetical protein VE197_18730, partial [Mycobacterium sp.]|nr:hypothetical protein [Mycobacterium sp.]